MVTCPFPFTDLTTSKKRPALVLAALRDFPDLIVCMISSGGYGDRHAIEINKANFVSGGLPIEPSRIRPTRLFTMHEDVVLGSVGQLTSDTMNDVYTVLNSLLS